MKDVLLKIMFKHFVQDKEHYEGCTTEIADIVKAFDKWKDNFAEFDWEDHPLFGRWGLK